jgi:hypothetical protein
MHGRMHTPLDTQPQDNALFKLITLNYPGIEIRAYHSSLVVALSAPYPSTTLFILITTPDYTTALAYMPPRLDLETLVSVAEHVKEPINLIRGSDRSGENAIKKERQTLLNLMKACKVRIPSVSR